jgi:FlaA1/EpsC-like NDP-sugar epimerase
VIENKHVDEVIIAIPSAPGSIIRLVNDACRQKGISSRTMPGMYELIGGKVSVNRLREVDITDLLRREPVTIDDHLVGSILSGKRIMVTGAGGSIGREICRQVARWSPAELILLGHGENSIFESLLELNEDFPSLSIHPVIADVRDVGRIEEMFKLHQPQVVFHAAAHKHVPLMEANVEEAITNNVLGTRNVVGTANRYGVERLVLISTDKAVRPVSIMGATKRLAEMIVLDTAQRTKRAYSVVRFGNVLGSRGSVVPKFKNQIARGGPVTITHPEMYRYFMTIPEAVHLVLQAASMGQGGEVFMLNMGSRFASSILPKTSSNSLVWSRIAILRSRSLAFVPAKNCAKIFGRKACRLGQRSTPKFSALLKKKKWMAMHLRVPSSSCSIRASLRDRQPDSPAQ